MCSKIELYNKNGDEMCHAFGCRKHTKLNTVYRGLFCPKHAGELRLIRRKIKFATSTEEEIKYRTEEMLFRKRFDESYVAYINKLIHSTSNEILDHNIIK